MWTFFEEIQDDPRYTKCMLCYAKISRGSDFKQYQTKSGMNKHLQRKHLESWKKAFPTKKVPEKCKKEEMEGEDPLHVTSDSKHANKYLFLKENLTKSCYELKNVEAKK